MGHIPVSKKKSTRRYSPADPYHPEYMINAIAAVEAFFREVNRHTKKWNLERRNRLVALQGRLAPGETSAATSPAMSAICRGVSLSRISLAASAGFP
jgi:hypothetical protein